MPKLPQIKRSRRKDNPEARMSIGDHLRELRNRLFISALGVLVMSVVGYVLYEQAFSLITRPIDAANARGANLTLNFDTILASFDMRLQVSIWLGVLFSAGAALGIWVMPHAVAILTSFIPDGPTAGLINAGVYLSFTMRLVVVFGLAFLLPELLVALNMLGLMKGSTMLKGWRWAVVAIFTFMAFANPLPDAWSMIFMALPVTGLYFLACFISIMHDKRVEKKRAELDAELEAALAE